MPSEPDKLVRLSDYRAPDHLIDEVLLDISLHPTRTRVRSRLRMRPNPAGRASSRLKLDGDGLTATRIALDGVELDPALARPNGLELSDLPNGPFELEIDSLLDPSANTQLMGLYKSGSAYCTQCEAEGFRRITYFLDRPDVLSVYTTRIEGRLSETPILLGNGNLVERGTTADGVSAYAVWKDPFPKPCYLFAVVGGDLAAVHDAFVTSSGRRVALGVYVEHGKEDRALYAMDALKRAMAWDETRFGREYDLDVFNIVAVSDFNMGAMENKGLNVFNDKYILALPRTATDVDYAGIEAVVAHEYFHNWTGNRITCRDWFQLCLKEGLTVYRDQEFSADQRSRVVKRIADVRTLRAQQFPEDAGPLAHNVRPETYREINNFYTPTVYEKGAEIVRVLENAIGSADFHKGMDLYFERCDGTAATVEDFLSCFAEAAGRDLTQFARWYSQAGTPVLKVETHYDDAARTATLSFSQWTAPTPGQDSKAPLVIPIALGLLGSDGADIHLVTPGPNAPDGALPEEIERGVFLLTDERRRITFLNVPSRPTPSLLRGFSAPVRLESDLEESSLRHVLAHDRDWVNRWQAAQTYATKIMIRSTDALRAGRAAVEEPGFLAAIGEALQTTAEADPAFAAQILLLPSEADVARDIGSNVDPDAVHLARNHLRTRLGNELKSRLLALRDELTPGVYAPDADGAGRRALRNAALDLLAAADSRTGEGLARAQFDQADNMTDKIAALSTLSLTPGPARDNAIDAFYSEFKADPLAIDKWFSLQAMIPEPQTLDRVRGLMLHEAFTSTNPNRLRALVGSFASANPTQFNAPDGRGFEFLCDIVLELDSRNPQVAARLLNAFRSWKSLERNRRDKAETALSRVAEFRTLSPDVRDIVDRSLA